MAAQKPVLGHASVQFRQDIDGIACYNTLYVGRSDGGSSFTAAEVQDVADAARSSWVANFIPLQTSNLTLQDVVVTDLSSSTGPVGTATGSTAGTATGAFLTANAALVVSKKIGDRYRGGHPRWYVGGIPQTAAEDANNWLAATVTAHQTAAEALDSTLNSTALLGGGTTVHRAVRRIEAGVVLDVPKTFTVLSVKANAYIGSQRGRLF